MRLALAAALILCASPAWAQDEGRIAAIRIHGNHTTPDADVLALSGLAVGEPATAARLDESRRRLADSHRFESVEVRRRFQSIADPSAILVVIVVDERAGVSPGVPLPGPFRRLRLATMWTPILSSTDGYGVTYGARFSFVDALGPRTRVSVPLSWGGDRRAALEVDKTLARGPFTTVSGALSAYRRVNPYFDVPDMRLEARGRAERRLGRWVRAGASARVARVDFAGVEARHTSVGVDALIDTRLDPSFPRDAVHARVGWDRLTFDGGRAGLVRADVRGYLGVAGSTVLALRGQLARASAPLPASEQVLLGGADSLRGYRAGYRAGDRLVAASAELRVPLTSPLLVARLGVKGFVDAGTTWSSRERLVDQAFDRGIGAGVYAGVAAFMLDLDVAWPETGGPRVHFQMGVTF